MPFDKKFLEEAEIVVEAYDRLDRFRHLDGLKGAKGERYEKLRTEAEGRLKDLKVTELELLGKDLSGTEDSLKGLISRRDGEAVSSNEFYAENKRLRQLMDELESKRSLIKLYGQEEYLKHLKGIVGEYERTEKRKSLRDYRYLVRKIGLGEKYDLPVWTFFLPVILCLSTVAIGFGIRLFRGLVSAFIFVLMEVSIIVLLTASLHIVSMFLDIENRSVRKAYTCVNYILLWVFIMCLNSAVFGSFGMLGALFIVYYSYASSFLLLGFVSNVYDMPRFQGILLILGGCVLAAAPLYFIFRVLLGLA